MTTLLSSLRNRGRIHDVSHFEDLEKLLEAESVCFYCGFDPTGDSLHVGSMLPLVIMRRIQEAGHTPLVVLGAATGMIGDPSGKSEERQLLTPEQIETNIQGIEKQIGKFLSAKGKNGYKLVRNDEWLGKINYIEFLRDVGKHFSVNAMIAKESVKARLENREQGISYTEFSYMLLQAYDYYHLNKKYNCRLQVGGSDQWGNITAGMDFIRRKNTESHANAFGLTFPLLTTASGTKFGKTERGAVWLNAEKTSPYRFYQYWLNTADDDVMKFLNLFTELEGAELQEFATATKDKPQERLAQKKLAATLTELVHSKKDADRSVQASQVLFGGSLDNVDSEMLKDIFSDVPSTTVSKAELSENVPLQDLLVRCEVAKSKGAAKRLIEGGGIYVNNERISDLKENVNTSRFIDESVLVIRSGKKNYYLVQIG